MAKIRIPIPAETKNVLLLKTMSRCSVCYQEQVVFHHLDGDPSNNDETNLIVLCLHHHGLAHAKFKLAQNYTPELLTMHKKKWEGMVAEGKALPVQVTEATALHLFRTYERQQTALRTVLVEELNANYVVVKFRYANVGGKTASSSTQFPVAALAGLRNERWKNLTDMGHLQEYVELLARTYVAIDNYNYDLMYQQQHFKGHVPARDLADWNLRVATAISMSMTPLLISLEREPLDYFKDFGDSKFEGEFPQMRD